MSMRWCGTAACSAALGLAVPMSMSRYTNALSKLMISQGTSAAMCRESAVLPLAVGAMMARAEAFMAGGFARGAGCFSG